MKKILLLSILAVMPLSANAAYSFPENATTIEKNRMTLLDSLSYSIDTDKDITKDDVTLCLAESVDNGSDEIIKVSTDTAVIAMGKHRVDKNGWGNDNFIKYDVKVAIQPEKVLLKFYKIGFAYTSGNQTADNAKYREASTIFGGGGKETVATINSIASSIDSCLGQS